MCTVGVHRDNQGLRALKLVIFHGKEFLHINLLDLSLSLHSLSRRLLL